MSYFHAKCSIPYLWDLTLDWPLLPNQKVPGVSVCQLCTSTGLASRILSKLRLQPRCPWLQSQFPAPSFWPLLLQKPPRARKCLSHKAKVQSAAGGAGRASCCRAQPLPSLRDPAAVSVPGSGHFPEVAAPCWGQEPAWLRPPGFVPGCPGLWAPRVGAPSTAAAALGGRSRHPSIPRGLGSEVMRTAGEQVLRDTGELPTAPLPPSLLSSP